MSSLVHENRRVWDADLIADLFCERDKHLILSIPLSLRTNSSGWYWLPDRRGCYTVRSGYRCLTNASVGDPNPRLKWMWSKIWALKVPPKIRTFVWRACVGCLPVRDLLLSR